ncbi:hypothetical protein G7Z17_g4632 [Cylindrodendrum hubeiense]|uniref:Small ribosomal subunit protein mS23 n=1 Tax=Cylindrodendrum hubeiense TaxID=595255 RepID=A0A9P5H8J2_9HYPO|nr:hypothetical protein G7Z17_g4632 [Cylindrodendrum hubeiense]
MEFYQQTGEHSRQAPRSRSRFPAGLTIRRPPKFPLRHRRPSRSRNTRPPTSQRQLTYQTLAMGGRQIRPAKVYQTVTQELNQRILGSSASNPPPWYNIMTSVPPAESLVRTLSPNRWATNPKAKKPKNLFRPQRIAYLEDSLRNTFYKDHPWELARPRVILELDGKDYQRVVQRQMWLMNNEKMTKRNAYDVTRREFYRIRQEEQIEKRVAVEEARHVGAYFGKSRIDVAHHLEDREFENWKVWAGKETERQEALRNSEVEGFGAEEEAEVDADAAPDAVVAAVAETKV